MNSPLRQGPQHGSSPLTNGFVDLMTSLVVIFILLLAAYVTRGDEGDAKTAPSRITAEPKTSLDPPRTTLETRGPSVLTVVVPETVLNFEFGKSRLMPAAERFLYDAMPHYATIVCGAGTQEVESFMIEGHTDDLGDDVLNLKLSQERSLAVLTKSLEVIREKLPWAYECFLQKATATGRGRQDLLRSSKGVPDRDNSRRVIFKIHLRP